MEVLKSHQQTSLGISLLADSRMCCFLHLSEGTAPQVINGYCLFPLLQVVLPICHHQRVLVLSGRGHMVHVLLTPALHCVLEMLPSCSCGISDQQMAQWAALYNMLAMQNANQIRQQGPSTACAWSSPTSCFACNISFLSWTKHLNRDEWRNKMQIDPGWQEACFSIQKATCSPISSSHFKVILKRQQIWSCCCLNLALLHWWNFPRGCSASSSSRPTTPSSLLWGWGTSCWGLGGSPELPFPQVGPGTVRILF